MAPANVILRFYIDYASWNHSTLVRRSKSICMLSTLKRMNHVKEMERL